MTKHIIMTQQENKVETKRSVSIIISVYNEEKVLKEFYAKAKSTLTQLNDYNIQLIFVNDGSKDRSQSILNEILAANDSTFRIQIIEFSKNYGHEAAMIAGIDNCNDDIAICMDSDLQHPLEEVSNMIKAYEDGYDIVLMNRVKRHDNGIFKNFLSKLFYKIIDKLSENKFEKNASDFFMISKKVSQILKQDFRERNRFLRGIIQIIGFNMTSIDYQSPERFAGQSNYSLKSLAKLGVTAIFAFSNKPLKISLIFSLLFFFFSIAVIIYSLIIYFWGSVQPPAGYTSIMIFMSIGFTVISLIISILSIYFGRSLDEIRNRPIYLIKTKNNKRNSK